MLDKYKAMVVIMMYRWGYKNPSITYQENQRIARAAANQVAYDNGYKKSVSHHAAILWEIDLTLKLDYGEHTSAKHIGSTSYVEYIEKKHPDYFHFLY